MTKQKSNRQKITLKMIKRVYEMASGRFRESGTLGRDDIATIRDVLEREEGMNKSSAKMHAISLSKLLTGNRYGPSISQEALKYCLDNIHSGFGSDGLKRALSSLCQCIKSIEEKQSKICERLREIHNEFSTRLN